MSLKLVKLKIVKEVDKDPDLSWIGEYGNQPTSPDAIDRRERGDMSRGEYRYFNPAMTGEESGNPDSPERDYQRMEDYSRGNWCMVGIWAEARVHRGKGFAQNHTLCSGGLWGIESDSDDDHFREVAGQELEELKQVLQDFGVPLNNFDKLAAEALENME